MIPKTIHSIHGCWWYQGAFKNSSFCSSVISKIFNIKQHVIKLHFWSVFFKSSRKCSNDHSFHQLLSCTLGTIMCTIKYHKNIGLQTSEMLMLFEICRNIVFCYQRFQLKKNFLRKKFFSKQNYDEGTRMWYKNLIFRDVYEKV